MRKVTIGLTSLLIIGLLCAPATTWYHAGGPIGRAIAAHGVPRASVARHQGGMGPGALVAIAVAAHLVATAPGVAPAIAAAQRPAGMGRGTRQARKGERFWWGRLLGPPAASTVP